MTRDELQTTLDRYHRSIAYDLAADDLMRFGGPVSRGSDESTATAPGRFCRREWRCVETPCSDCSEVGL